MATAKQDDETLAQDAAQTQVQELRARAALAMMIASVAIGFIAGRASVWFVPFDAPRPTIAGQQTAKLNRTDAGPPPSSDGKSSRPPTPLALPEKPAGSERTPGPPVPSAVVSAPVTPSGAGAQGPEPAGKADPGAARQGVTLVNPGYVDAGPDAQDVTPPAARPASTSGEEGNDAKPAGIEECERRYSSFRRSDGTYQPYGGGARTRCPLLR